MAGTYTRWYRVGTVKTVKDSTSIVGTNTYWLTAGINPGDLFTTTDGKNFVEILSVTDDTHLTLATPYPYDGSSGIHYAICRNFTAHMPSQIAADTAKLVGDMARYWDEDTLTLKGESAYEIAKRLGKTVASEGAWINSLKGDSAYDVAVAEGFTGTKAQWLETLKGAGTIGSLSALSTSAKGTVVAAVNEVNTKATNATSATAGIGTLSSLKTSAKGTLVAAINEVVDTNTSQSSTISTHTSDISGLKTRCSDIEAVNTSQASSISTINARTLGIVNGGVAGNYACSMHNSIWRGKSLGKFTAAHSEAIRNGTFTDMYLGDFFRDAANSWQYMYQIIGFDYFYALSFTNNAHHIVLRRNEKFDSTFNSTNSTTGGYLNSTWRTETKPALEEQYAADFIDSSHLWHHTDYLSSACSGGKVTGCTTVTDSCVELFDERQVTGARYSHTCEKDAVGVTTAFTQQFPAYAFFENFGWQRGSCLTRTIISDTQLRIIYNCQADWAVNANTSAFTQVYLTVN